MSTDTAEQLDLKLSNIEVGFEILEGEFLDFLNGFDLDDSNPEALEQFKAKIQEYVNAINNVKDNWESYLQSLVESSGLANYDVGSVLKRSSWSIKDGVVSVNTQYPDKNDYYTNNIPVDLFKEIVEVSLEQIDRFSFNYVLTRKVTNLMKNKIAQLSNYKEDTAYTVVYSVFKVLQLESLMTKSLAKYGAYVFNKPSAEIRDWLNNTIK